VFQGKTILAKYSEEYTATEDHAAKDSRAIIYNSVIKGNQSQYALAARLTREPQMNTDEHR
jgi:hypothetical protein